MALQNTRALLFRGEDTSYGGAAAKEVIWTTTAAAAARPLIYSLGFVGSTAQLNNLLGVYFYATGAMAGLNRVLVNRSPRFWLNLQCQLGQGNNAQTTYTINIPVAPRQMMFLPHTVYNNTGQLVSSDSAWPLVQQPGPAVGAAPPTAGTTSAINLDLVVEQ